MNQGGGWRLRSDSKNEQSLQVNGPSTWNEVRVPGVHPRVVVYFENATAETGDQGVVWGGPNGGKTLVPMALPVQRPVAWPTRNPREDTSQRRGMGEATPSTLSVKRREGRKKPVGGGGKE